MRNKERIAQENEKLNKKLTSEFEDRIDMLVAENTKLTRLLEQYQQRTELNSNSNFDLEKQISRLVSENDRVNVIADNYKKEADIWKQKFIKQ